MLYYQAIDPKALELLREFSRLTVFKEMRLAGGTALALQIGHRKSVDIDLFGKINADEFSLTEQLKAIGKTTILSKSENIKVFLVNNIKVDIVNYPYPWLENAVLVDDLRLAGIADIAAMKLAAVTGRGTKKDFTDIYFLLKHHSIKEMLSFYNKKYHDGSEFMVLKSLTYFEDAETDESLLMLVPVSWLKTKDFIRSKVEEYLKNM